MIKVVQSGLCLLPVEFMLGELFAFCEYLENFRGIFPKFPRLLPQIYRIVALGSDDTALFLRSMRSMPSSFFANHVRHLCLSISVSSVDAERILSVCTGVTDLAFWIDYISVTGDYSIAPLVSPLRLRRLSIELKHFDALFSDTSIRHAWCDSLTHLDIIFWNHELSPDIPHLNHLSSLTYLALRLRHNEPREESLFSILSICQHLKAVIIYDESDSPEEVIWTKDPRVVYMPYPTNVITEWEAQARQDDMCAWSRAERAIRSYVTKRQSWCLHIFLPLNLSCIYTISAGETV